MALRPFPKSDFFGVDTSCIKCGLPGCLPKLLEPDAAGAYRLCWSCCCGSNWETECRDVKPVGNTTTFAKAAKDIASIVVDKREGVLHTKIIESAISAYLDGFTKIEK